MEETEARKAGETHQSGRTSRCPGPHLNPNPSGSKVCAANHEAIRAPKPQRLAGAEQVGGERMQEMGAVGS